MSPLFMCAYNKFDLSVASRSPTGVKLTADLCFMSLLCFHSTYNGIERSSSSHHTVNLVLLFGIYIYIYIYTVDGKLCGD